MQSALTGVEGVNSVNVAMPDKAEVKGTAKLADLIAAVERAGYTAAQR